MILEAIKLCLYVVCAYMLVYRYIDLAVLYKKAKETATGAGLAFLGICILVVGIMG